MIYSLSLHDALPISEVRRLTERLDCPVLTSLNGKGILDERDPRALGHARSMRGRVAQAQDRKSTRLNSSHTVISYAVFCLKKKKKINRTQQMRHQN